MAVPKTPTPTSIGAKPRPNLVNTRKLSPTSDRAIQLRAPTTLTFTTVGFALQSLVA